MRLLILLLPLLLSGCLTYVDYDPPHVVELSEPPCVRPHDGYRYQTCNPYSILIDGAFFEVPEGFDTDFASIPQFLWWKVAPHQAQLVAPSIVHDYMYACPGDYTRRFIDDVFYSALLESGVSGGKALKMYYAVRLAGEKFYKKGVYCHAHAES